MDGGAWWAAVHGVAKSRTWQSDFNFTFHFHSLEKEMATHYSVLAWRIPGMGEPGGLPSMGSHRVGHDWSDLAAAAALWRSQNGPMGTHQLLWKKVLLMYNPRNPQFKLPHLSESRNPFVFVLLLPLVTRNAFLYSLPQLYFSTLFPLVIMFFQIAQEYNSRLTIAPE